MAKIPDKEARTVQAIYDWYENRAEEEAPRQYLGGSLIGHYCERYLWLSFRQAKREKFPGRILRLFEHGQREEDRMAENLRDIGCELLTQQEVDGHFEQYGFQKFGGHFRGHYDGVVLGIPEAPKTWHLWECKTHNDKSFKALVKSGVLLSKPMHYAQMQVYMGEAGLERALYTAINKDTDEIYVERVVFDPAEYERLIKRAERVIFSDSPTVPPLGADASWHQCQHCIFLGLCYGQELPDVHCRTCAHVTPKPDGSWLCEKYDKPLDGDYASLCPSYVINHTSTDWVFFDCIDGGVAYGKDQAGNRVILSATRPNDEEEPF